ncbi:mechanosensitive ion channel family protein [Deinococcus multiflagellatus]|uniref:Mechanosensitive ion channel family protein n=1 Tax=Deinococcus multiflagellatus TaxID=1656887 RepID=A0ABW1ZQD5_9DEIO|nr:mechanosensitive ion channel family protein [Deinococcus multiflagellatus]MBZ9715414.1 mechanosensitive ion channel family protein [Deinococcus multiflagellatus]
MSVETALQEFIGALGWLGRRLPLAALSVVILVITYLLSRWTFQGMRWVLRRVVRDRLLASFVARLLSYTVFVAGVAVIIRLLGWQDEVATVVAGAGLTVAVLGFAFRDIGENLLAGLFLAASRPFTVGDIVQVGGVEGTVLRIDLRYTQLRTFDGRDAFVPNAQVFKEPVFNATRNRMLRGDFEFEIGDGDDLLQVQRLGIEALTQLAEVVDEPAPYAAIVEPLVGKFRVRFYFWTRLAAKRQAFVQLKGEAILAVWTALSQSGIRAPVDTLALVTTRSEDTFLPARQPGGRQAGDSSDI